jgi:hypothetical protein
MSFRLLHWRKRLPLLAALIILSTYATAQTVTVPQGKPIMVDGKLTPGEWSDAKQLAVGDFAEISFKQSNNDVLIAIKFLKAKNGTADLYISSAGRMYDLHASAKLGERTLENAHWPEEWTWWNNDRWVANVSRPDDWSKRTFKDEKVREYQISRERFQGKEWKIFLELMTPAEPKWQTSTYPPIANSSSDGNWIVLQLD